jgi:hypothetical protein
MIVEILTVADYAQETNGKLTIVGTFNEFRVDSFPALGNAYLVMRCRIMADEPQPKQFHVQLCTSDGKEKLLSFDIEVTGQLANKVVPSLSLNMVVKIDIKFEHAGMYVAEVMSDTGYHGMVLLTVVHNQPQAKAD